MADNNGIQTFTVGPDPEVQTYSVDSAPWSEVLNPVTQVQNLGLGIIEGGAGIARSILDAVHADSFADVAGEIARNAKGASDDLTPAGQNFAQQAVSGAIQSVGQMAPAIIAGPEAVVPAGIAMAAGQQYGQRYTEIRDAGFSGGRAALHAGIEGLSEALGEAISLPVLTQTTRPFLNRLYHFMARDLAGEEFTTTVEQASAMLSDNPGMTWGDFLNGLAQTAVQTPLAAGMQTGLSALHPGYRTQTVAPDNTMVTPPADPTVQPNAPVPVDQTVPGPQPTAPAPTVDQLPDPSKGTADTSDTDNTSEVKPAPTTDSVSLPNNTWQTIDTDAGQRIQHDSGVYIQEVPGDGWHLVAPQPDGTGQTVVKATTKEGALQEAQNLGLDYPLPPDWTRQPDTLSLRQKDGYYLTVEGSKSWNLYDPNGMLAVNNITGTLSPAFFNNVNRLIERDKAYEAQNNPPPAPPPPATVSAFDMTPDQMIAQKSYDPQMFDGYPTNVGTIGVVKVGPDAYKVTIAGREVVTSGADALKGIQSALKIDISNPGVLYPLYHHYVINQIVQDPARWVDVSPEVSNYFGGKLQEVSKQAGATDPSMKVRGSMLESVINAIVAGTSRINAIRDEVPPSVKDAKGKSYATNSVNQVTGLKNGTYLDTSIHADATWKKYAAWVDTLRNKYAPGVTIVLKEVGRAKEDMLGGATNKILPGTYVIQIQKALHDGQTSQALWTLAHEFGHVIIFEHIAQASPEFQAGLVASWMEYTRGANGESSLLKYLAEHQADPRNGLNYKMNEVGNLPYLLSQSEYFADQAAMYFLHRHSSDLMAMSPQHGIWYEQLINKLANFWQSVMTKFKENVPFATYLDQLGRAGKAVSAWKTTIRDDPNPTVKPNTKPNPLKSKAQIEALYEKRRRIFNALIRAKISSEDLQALNMTKKIEDFNWNSAYGLLEKYGVPESWYGGRYLRGAWDETSGLRRGMVEMAAAVPGEEHGENAAESSKAIKSFAWFLQKTMTAVQVRKKFGDMVPGVKNFVDSLEQMWSYRSRFKEIADGRVKQMKETGPAERERVFNMMLDEDKSGDYQSTITQGPTGRIYTPTPEAVKKYGLTDKGVSLYMNLRSDFANALDELENQALAELARTYSPGPALIKAQNDLRDGFDQMKARPYVPHTRFGNNTVTVRKNGTVTQFYQLESERAAKALEVKLRKEAASDEVVSRGVMTDIQKSMIGLPPQLALAMKAHLQLSPEQIATFEDMLKDMSNGASFVRRFKHRKDIAGWESDAKNFPRAYADYMTKYANHVSRLKYNHILGQATQQVRSQATDMSKMGVNTVEVNGLANWLQRLQDYINQPGQEFTAARAAGTLYFLGFNVKSALVNATSVPMVTVPYLSTRFGWARAFAATSQAYKDIAQMYLKKEALTDDEKKMLQELRRTNKIDASFASELAGLREGGRLSDMTALTKAAAAFYGVRYYGMWMFQKMEVLNREVTALAAYRLNRTQRGFDSHSDEGYDHAALEKAGLAIQDTQNENAQWNRPEMMRGRKSVLTMFMSYQQNLTYQMLGGDESWMRLLAVQMMAAGLLGIPFAQDIDELIKWFSRKVFGTDMSAERALRAYLKDVMGDPDWVLKGASHNVFGLDLSGSLSQGRAIPGIDALAMEGNFNDRLANAAGDVGGAGFSIILQFMKSLASNDPDVWRRFQRAWPQAVQAMVDGGQMLSGGKALDAQGRPIVDVSKGDALMRTLGFQLTNVAQDKGKRFAQQDTAQFWLTRRAYVMGVWELAVEGHDNNWREKAMSALRDYNNEVPDAQLKITAQQLRQSMMSRVKGDTMVSQGLPANRNLTQTYNRVGGLY